VYCLFSRHTHFEYGHNTVPNAGASDTSVESGPLRAHNLRASAVFSGAGVYDRGAGVFCIPLSVPFAGARYGVR